MPDHLSQYRLRILHISDLHERGPRETEPWRRRRVLGEAWEDNIAELLQDGPIDLVCFTGDAANWGLWDEYEHATDFFLSLMDRLHLPVERLFVIPGNHDIVRTVNPKVWEAVRKAAPAVDELVFARWVAGGPTPPGFKANWLDKLLARQNDYRRWVRESLNRPELDPASEDRRLGYRVSLSLHDWNFPIHVIGADTGWLCGDENDAGRLRLTDHQVQSLACDEKGNALKGLRLFLMHHPFGDLADGAACRRLLGDRVDFLMRGHLHDEEIEIWADPDRKTCQLAAGSLYEGDRADHWPNACHTITLTLDPSGRVLKADLRFRSWSRRGHWHDDDGLCKDSKSGRLTWIVSEPTPCGDGEFIFDPWTPAVPPRFVGRRLILESLERALNERRSVSLVGDWRIGKSSILQTWAQKAAAAGRVVRLLDAQGPEGVSESAFVRKATGLKAPDSADGAADALSRWAEAIGLAGLPPLLLVDEADCLLSRLHHRFFERLRGMLDRITLVFSTRREIDLIYKDLNRTSPFHNRLELVRIALLEQNEFDELIALGAASLGPGDGEFIRKWAGPHPFHAQLLARRIADSRRIGNGPNGALDRFLDEAGGRFRELWNHIDARDRTALIECARAGILSERPSLRRRGLVLESGLPFSEAFSLWLLGAA